MIPDYPPYGKRPLLVRQQLAHTELGDMHSPSCHKGAMESALVSLAQRTAASFAQNGLSAI